MEENSYVTTPRDQDQDSSHDDDDDDDDEVMSWVADPGGDDPDLNPDP